VVLWAGHIEQIGPPMHLYHDPNSKFVAGFIGSPAMNFLAGTLTKGTVEVPALQTSVSMELAAERDGQNVSFGLRPEHIGIDPAGDTHVVELTESLGGVSYTYLMSGTGEKLVVEERGDTRTGEGRKVGLRFDPKNALVFDARTEQRIRA
jgi:multiple sugar transport system ATP-binding protein